MSELEKLTPCLWKRGPWYLHWCEACESGHVYSTNCVNGPNWAFDENIEQPSFSPSMLIFDPGPDGKTRRTLCHYFLTSGHISYCSDSPHHLSGQTVPLVPIPEDYGF